MPNYDYKCTYCDNKFEVFHSMTDLPQITCTKCDSKAVKTISSNVGIAFKGSGFYVNDSKKS